MIPYAKHHLEAEDLMQVLSVLQGPSITQGASIDWLEEDFRKFVGSKYAVAVSSGTAALHVALMAIGIQAGDEVIVPSMTFVATANVVKYLNAIPVFVDIDENTLLIDTEDVEQKITEKTKAIIAVDFAGQPADYDKLNEISKKYNIKLIADACHSLGANYKEKKVGTLADLSCFSLHPTKLITSGEGGIVTTNSRVEYEKMKACRNHGRENGDMIYLGNNYRMSDIQAALCVHQIKRIPELVENRQRLAKIYDEEMDKANIEHLEQKTDRTNARHIYVIKTKYRDDFRTKLAAYDINTQIHYKPITLQSFYNCPGVTPKAEKIWKTILTIPLYLKLSDQQQKKVISSLQRANNLNKKNN